MKQASEQTVTGENNVHQIALSVSAMKHLWHPTVGPDSGIDGEIELRDPATQEVRNVRIAVQSKGTSKKWPRETANVFSFRPKPKDVSYWMTSSQPVIIICGRPGGELYWRSVQEWANDPLQRAKGYVRFDKNLDRFDVSAAEKLFDLRAQGEERVEPPGPTAIPETLTTNLMPILWKADRLQSVAVPSYSDPAELFDPAWKRGLFHPAGTLKHGRYWSLAPLDPRFVAAIGAEDLYETSTAAAFDGEDLQIANVLKELVVRSVTGHAPELRWHAFKRTAYFKRQEDEKDVTYTWHAGKPKTVVAAGFHKEHGHFTGYRHDAAELRVRELDDRWALQVTPTYLFTFDGHKLSTFHDSALAGRKRLDRHGAFDAALRMWEHLLLDQPTVLQPDSRPGFDLGRLLTVEMPFLIDEGAWKKMPDEDAAQEDSREGPDIQLDLLDEAA